MKMPVPSGYVALLAIVAVVVLLTAPHSSMAAPAGFELDLKELKKPAPPLLPPQKLQPSTAPKKARHQAPAKTAAKKPAPAASPRERTVRLQNGTACDVAQQLLTVLATPVPLEPVLHDIAIPAVAAARRHDTTTVVACGLPAAEAYTFTRLLEADNVRLINLRGDEPPAQVVQTVAHHLGLSFRQKQEHPLSYLTTDPQGDPLLVLVGNGAAP